MKSCYAILLLLLLWNIDLLGQPEVLPLDCAPKAKALLTPAEKDSLIDLIKAKENPACGWKDRESGFDKKVRRLITITTLDERTALFSDSSVNLKYYLFPSILLENDSIAFELLKLCIADKTELVTLCSCMTEDDPIGLRLALMYYWFIQLKYYYGVSGTMNGITFSFGNHQPKPQRKIWRQKRSDFKSTAEMSFPGFEKNLSGSSLKLWN